MTANDIRFWLFVAISVFLFAGEPDVWDKLHDYAMNINTKECIK